MVSAFTKMQTKAADEGSFVKISAQTKVYRFDPRKATSGASLNGLFADEEAVEQSKNSTASYMARFDDDAYSRQKLADNLKGLDANYASKTGSSSLRSVRDRWFQKNREIKATLYANANRATGIVSSDLVENAVREMESYNFTATVITVSIVRKSYTEGIIPKANLTRAGYYSRESTLTRVITGCPIEQVEAQLEQGMFTALLNEALNVQAKVEYRVSKETNSHNMPIYKISPVTTTVIETSDGARVSTDVKTASDEKIQNRIAAVQSRSAESWSPESLFKGNSALDALVQQYYRDQQR